VRKRAWRSRALDLGSEEQIACSRQSEERDEGEMGEGRVSAPYIR